MNTMKLNKEQKQEIRDTIKGNLHNDFIENYSVWKSSLDDVNEIIRTEVNKCLFVTTFNDELLYTYDELCIESLNIVDSLDLNGDIDPNVISKEITQQITHNKLSNIFVTYLYNIV